MKLLLYIYQCKNCGVEFKSPELLGIPYGEFLMRTDIGEQAYLYALDDKVFKQFSQLLKLNKKLSSKKETEIAKIHQKIYGYICDKSPKKYYYNIGKKPICPQCGSNKMASWSPTKPPETVEQEVPKITYSFWEKMKEEDKKQYVEKLLNRFLLDI